MRHGLVLVAASCYFFFNVTLSSPVATRKDLVAAYDSLKQLEKAAPFRAELTDTAGKGANAAKRK